MKKFIITSLFTLIIISSLLITINHISALQEPQQTAQTNLEVYSYTVTNIDSEGVYGDSTKDDTGIFLAPENIKGLHLKVNDHINVTFPKDDYETITKVEKVND
jgi:transcription termination factor Rho